MREKIAGGQHVVVKVLPSEVENLQDDDIIIVNRAQVNAQLAFMSMDTNNKHAKENIQILKCAINNMLEQEKNQRSMAVGAKMTVSQVKQTFSKIEKMPQNSFVQVRA